MSKKALIAAVAACGLFTGAAVSRAEVNVDIRIGGAPPPPPVVVVQPAPVVVVEPVRQPLYDSDWALRNAQYNQWQAQSDLDAARAHEAAIAQQVGDAEADVRDLKAKCADLDARAGAMQSEFDRAKADVADRRAQLEAIQRRLDVDSAEMARIKGHVEDDFLASYEYRRAARGEAEAKANVDAVTQRGLDSLSHSGHYQSTRTRMRAAQDMLISLQRQTPAADPADIADATNQLKRLTDDARAQESAVLDQDPDVRAARADYDRAASRLNDLRADFERSLSRLPGYAIASDHYQSDQAAFTAAQHELAAAEYRASSLDGHVDPRLLDALDHARADLQSAEQDVGQLHAQLNAAEDATFAAEQRLNDCQHAVAEALYERDRALLVLRRTEFVNLDYRPCGGFGVRYGWDSCRQVVEARPVDYYVNVCVRPANYWVVHPVQCETRIVEVDHVTEITRIREVQRVREVKRVTELERVERVVKVEDRRTLAENAKIERERFDAERSERETAKREGRAPRIEAVPGHEAVRTAVYEPHAGRGNPLAAPAVAQTPRVPRAINESFGHQPEPTPARDPAAHMRGAANAANASESAHARMDADAQKNAGASAQAHARDDAAKANQQNQSEAAHARIDESNNRRNAGSIAAHAREDEQNRANQAGSETAHARDDANARDARAQQEQAHARTDEANRNQQVDNQRQSEAAHQRVDSERPGHTGRGTDTTETPSHERPADTGRTGRGETPAPDSGRTGRGETPAPDPGRTGRGETPAPDSGRTGRSETPAPDSGRTGRGETPAPGSGHTGRGETPAPDAGRTGRGETPAPSDSGRSGRGSTPAPSDSGRTGRGETPAPSDSGRSGRTGRGDAPADDSGRTGRTGRTGRGDPTPDDSTGRTGRGDAPTSTPSGRPGRGN